MEDTRGTHYYLIGNALGDEVVNFLQTSEHILFVSGDFGSGKTTLIKALLKTNNYIFVPKKSTRAPRKLEREGRVPFDSIEIDDMLRLIQLADDTFFVCNNLILSSGELYEIEPLEHLKQTLSVYSFTEIYETCKEARQQNKFVVFEITPEQEKDWVFFFPRGKYVRLLVRKAIRYKRLRMRQANDPEIDPTGRITELKIKTSETINQSDMGFDRLYSYKLTKLPNNNPLDFLMCYILTRLACDLSRSKLKEGCL